MDLSDHTGAKQYEIQHLLIALDQLGKDFGHNRDTYYTLGRYLGYMIHHCQRLNLKKTLFLGYYVTHVLKHLLLILLTSSLPSNNILLNMVIGRISNISLLIMVFLFSSLLSSTYWKLY